MEALALLTAFIATTLLAFIVARGIAPALERYRKGRAKTKGLDTGSLAFSLVLPFSDWFGQQCEEMLIKWSLSEKASRSRKKLYQVLDTLLQRAGTPFKLIPGGIVAICVGSTLVGIVLGVLWHLAVADTMGTLVGIIGILIFPALLAYLPIAWLQEKTTIRKKEAEAQFPFALDLLSLALDSGLQFSAAFDRTVSGLKPGVIRDEFERAVLSLDVGTKTEVALELLETRLPGTGASRLRQSIVLARQFNTPLHTACRALASEMRQEHFALLEKKAGGLATLMMIPMALFTLPAVLLVVLAPVIFDLYQSMDSLT